MSHMPYGGITGFTDPKEVNQIVKQVKCSIPVSLLARRKIMVGVLVSSKTLAGFPNKWPGRFPPIERISTIFSSQPETINLIHFSTDEPTSLLEQLVKVTEASGPNVDGVQLNVAWPPINAVQQYRTYLEQTHCKRHIQSPRIVLQIGRLALEKAGHNFSGIAKLVADYAESGSISDILLDFSGGLGKPLSPNLIRELLNQVQSKCPDLGLGVAGGLWEQSLGLLEPLLQEFPALSFDAEGKLRIKGTDELDAEKATRYLIPAFKMSARNISDEDF